MICPDCCIDHRPGFTFGAAGTAITVATDARRHRCGIREHLIGGEGVAVCWGCLNLLAETTADPLYASPELRGALVELHGDVVRLRELETAAAAFEWVWTAPWPAAGDYRLIDGRVAA